ncbi:MAG: FumA C-terminus/TtdB family hydratase beta subunit [Candidatus Adiutrix sp.]|jgi:fumarate hydratase subunit beta|nr:FumA C-terminus/TtdB family hydratase beta subunit [Candidatus Adiutrix sp.]
MPEKNLQTPLTAAAVTALKAGDLVRLSGQVYTARDAAHQRLVERLKRGQAPPFAFEGQVVYYAGPCPAKPGAVIGPVGPTTSCRMDAFSPFLIDRGLKYMIGKGPRGPKVAAAIARSGGLYLAAVGGAAALMSRCVTAVELVAFDDLGTEAIRRLTVRELPLVVALDRFGGDVYRR